jgi:hypothetical protein
LDLLLRVVVVVSTVLPAWRAAGRGLPPASKYVVAGDDGDLYVGGRKVRFWGGIGGFPPRPVKKGRDPYLANRLMMERINACGFNMWRIWRYGGTIRGQAKGYTKGDGSKLDRYDHMIALAKKNGVRLWVGGAGANYSADPGDAGVIDEPATAAAWAQAVRGADNRGRREFHVAAAWDPRLEAALIRNNARFLDHVNLHTGLRVGDDPVFAIWELNNEQWWIVHMVTGRWQHLPKFFRDGLLRKWHGFLKAKYGDEETLVASWGGLKPGEGLEAGTIYLAPLRGKSPPAALNDANPRAAAKFAGEDVKYGREDFNIRRGRDVNEFFAGLILGHKRRVAAAFKKNGRAAKLSPLLWDTGIGYNGICQLLHQNADAVSHCAYIGGVSHDESHKRYPWFSGLEEPPRICLDVPWLEHNKVEGKPFFCYETNIGSPAKYRAEFPYRILFLAAIQDWDAVCWHTMSGGYDWNRPDPLDGPISSPGHAAVQFNFQHDEVLISAMHAAGRMFVGGGLKPAPKPTRFIFGRKTIFHPDSMDYAGSYGRNGRHMLNTVYRYGSRIKIDLDREDDEIIGEIVRMNSYGYPNPVKPTDQMVYDWHRGYLRIESPSGAAYTGFLAQYGSDRVEFTNGVVISDVSVHNPPDAPYPMTPEENYVAIAVTSSDGKPLGECSRAVVSAVSTSANRGLEVGRDPKAVRPGHPWAGSKVFKGAWKKPVIVSRVNCTIAAPALAGMDYRLRDWRWDVIGEGQVGRDGALTISARDPVFLVELER